MKDLKPLDQNQIDSNHSMVELKSLSNEIKSAGNSNNLLSIKWLYTRIEVASIFSVSLVTLWNWKQRNILNPLPSIGGKVYYTRNAIIEAMNKNSEK